LQVPIQICVLLETFIDGVSTFWFIGAEGERINRSSEIHCPFPTIKYRLNGIGGHFFFFSKVDIINEPVLVIPTSLQIKDFQYKKQIHERRTVAFTAIPFGFLNRDDWLPNTNVGLSETEDDFSRLPYIRKMWNKNLEPLYTELKQTLRKNGKGGRQLDDEDAIEEYVDEGERYTNNLPFS
jgi:hypothetical protein